MGWTQSDLTGLFNWASIIAKQIWHLLRCTAVKHIFTTIFDNEQTTFWCLLYLKIAQHGKQAAETQYNTSESRQKWVATQYS